MAVPTSSLKLTWLLLDLRVAGHYTSGKSCCVLFFEGQCMSTGFPESQRGDPTWEIASLFPTQGNWSAGEYLNLKTNRLVELDDGRLELLPMPTELHQLIAFYMCASLRNLGDGNPPGIAVMAPFRVRVTPTKFREPDVAFMLHKHRERRHEQFWEGADVVVEVVSEDDPNRDLETKRVEYAKAGITEYWIVDPRDRSVLVLTLDAEAEEYREKGRYGVGETASSALLEEFQVDVRAVFEQG